MSKILGIIGVIILLLIGWGFYKSDVMTVKATVVSGHPEWSPIMYKDGEEIKGAGPALVKIILDELDLKSSYPYVGAWDEVQAKARSGEVDMLAAAYKTDERVAYMDYSIPYTTDPVALFVRPGKEFAFTKWEDLISKNGVGTVGDSYGQTFDDFIKAKLKFSIASSSADAFAMVESGKADYFIYSLFAGEREIANQGRVGKITNLPQFVVEENFYITISKESPLVKYMPNINALIERYKADGTVDRLIEEYKAK